MLHSTNYIAILRKLFRLLNTVENKLDGQATYRVSQIEF